MSGSASTLIPSNDRTQWQGGDSTASADPCRINVKIGGESRSLGILLTSICGAGCAAVVCGSTDWGIMQAACAHTSTAEAVAIAAPRQKRLNINDISPSLGWKS